MHEGYADPGCMTGNRQPPYKFPGEYSNPVALLQYAPRFINNHRVTYQKKCQETACSRLPNLRIKPRVFYKGN